MKVEFVIHSKITLRDDRIIINSTNIHLEHRQPLHCAATHILYNLMLEKKNSS
jgi:hypothetical protein